MVDVYVGMKIEAQKKNAVKNQKSKGSQLVSLRPEPLLSKLAAPFVRSREHRGNRKAWSALRKKELYFCTCHNLIHNGKMSFWLDLSSGKKCYMISARELYIENGDSTLYWVWFTIPDANDAKPWWLPDYRFPFAETIPDSCLSNFDALIRTGLSQAK
ncbi:hypothetical protein Q3G72_032535 [Acer saccharum]|nr:hypothetical protein Q3G72_032535 [Acer saccharum]